VARYQINRGKIIAAIVVCVAKWVIYRGDATNPAERRKHRE
jgi:hypothetical protein